MDSDIFFLEAGYCVHPEKMVLRTGSWKPRVFPATVAVVQHPLYGVVLFDTGYSSRFHEATQHFPEKCYALITPVTCDPASSAVAQLKNMGIGVRDVRHVVLSHFHADHVAGVGDFPHAKYVYWKDAYEILCAKSRYGQLKAGFLKALLPSDFEARSKVVTEANLVPLHGLDPFFNTGYDVLGDGSMYLVPMWGHAPGHCGLYLPCASGEPYLLVGDAVWLSETYTQGVMPHVLTEFLTYNKQAYASTVHALHQVSKVYPQVRMVPCHCSHVFKGLPHVGKHG